MIAFLAGPSFQEGSGSVCAWAWTLRSSTAQSVKATTQLDRREATTDFMTLSV
jgi:hypothetical protein